MSNVLIPILPGNLPSSYCFTTWQKLLVDISNNQQAVLDGSSYFNYGPTTPAPEFELYPWLRTTDMRWYAFNGWWLSPNPEAASGDARRIWVGTLTGAGSLEEYDGGESGVASASAGVMWERDTDFDDRIPIGVGALTDATQAGVDAGAATHTLTEAEGATGVHTHGFGKYLNGAAGLSSVGNNTVPSYTGSVVQGIAGASTAPDTTANLFTLPSGAAGAGVTPAAFSVLPPVRGVYIIKRSARIYYRA
jgi:hypothetical protein